MDRSVESALKSFISSFEREIESKGIGGGRFIVQKAHIFAKFSSYTPCYARGCGFDDWTSQGMEQCGQEEDTRVLLRKLEEGLYLQSPQEAALGGQAGQDDDLNRKWAVYRHLEALVEIMDSPRNHLQGGGFSNSASTTVAASVPSATFSTRMQGRLASCCRRYTMACRSYWPIRGRVWGKSSKPRVISDSDFDSIPLDGFTSILFTGKSISFLEQPSTFGIQVDVLEFLTPHPTSTLGKKLCTAVNTCGQLSPRCAGDSTGGNEFRQPKKITGVRLRANKYVAELKPPCSKDSRVHIGQFSTQPEAARARDVGCYLYHRDKARMHYEDTPQLISMALTSAEHDAEDELLKFARLDDKEKVKFVQKLAKKIAKEQAEKLPSTHPRDPKTMRTSVRMDISQNRVQMTEETLAGESSGFELRRCTFEQSEIRETTSEFSDSLINRVDGILTTVTEQSRLSETEGWLDSIIIEDSSAAFSGQHGSPHELQIDQMEQPLEVSTEALNEVGAMILELMEEQDICQQSLEHVTGHPITNLETFGSVDFALSMTYQTLPAASSLFGSPSDDYSVWESEPQAITLDELGLFS